MRERGGLMIHRTGWAWMCIVGDGLQVRNTVGPFEGMGRLVEWKGVVRRGRLDRWMVQKRNTE